MKKDAKKHLLIVLITGIPIAALIIIFVCLNIFVFSPVPGNDYYAQTHIETDNVKDAIDLSENQLPIDKLRLKDKMPTYEKYIFEHTYGIPSYKDRLSFSIFLSYGTDESEDIDIFIPFNNDIKTEYLLNNIYTNDGSIKGNKEEIYISNTKCTLYESAEDENNLRHNTVILNCLSGGVEYFIKNESGNRDCVFEVAESLLN